MASLAIVHHANQYVIGDGYSDRQGMTDILGLRGAISHPAGFLPLLRMHLDYGIPLNLHLSGTLIEALAWHCPQSFGFIKDLDRAGLLEIVGSTFSQNVMPFFDSGQGQGLLGARAGLGYRQTGAGPAQFEPRERRIPLRASR